MNNLPASAATLTVAEKGAIADVRKTLIQARFSHEIWWTIEGEHPHRNEILRALNFYHSFFGALLPSTYIAYILGLASLFDQDSKSISLRSVPGIDCTEGFDDLWTRGRTLFRYRSKVIAHRDSAVLNQNFGGQLGLTYNGIRQILEDACRSFDIAASKIGEDSVPCISCAGDLLLLVTDINRRFHPKVAAA
jgi:hypothetical protein